MPPVHCWASLAEARLREIRTMLGIHYDRFGLGLTIVQDGPARVAWNTANPSILAALTHRGTSHLLAWHPSAGAIEFIEQPFEPVTLPADMSEVSLNWSESGDALRLRVGDEEKVHGKLRDGDSWAPASAISPDSSLVVVLRQNSIRIAHLGEKGQAGLVYADQRHLGQDDALSARFAFRATTARCRPKDRA
jgi:hypothetical protein